MKFSTSQYRIYFSVLLQVLSARTLLSAQIQKPTHDWTSICASQGYNSFVLNFGFINSGLQSNNEFILEISDANGSFSSPTELKRVAASASSVSPMNVTFSVPQTVSGELYKIRVRSTNPPRESPSTSAFAAHYIIHDAAFSINNGSNPSSNCVSGNYSIKIDENNKFGSESPLKYEQLTYKWYKEPSTTPIATTTSSAPDYTATESGTYYALTDYGSCSSLSQNSKSNKVTINSKFVNITPSRTDLICPKKEKNILTATAGASEYIWYKDDIIIPNATSATYEADEAGYYKVDAKFASPVCEITTEPYKLETISLTSSLSEADQTVKIKEEEPKKISVETNAINPSFQWFYENEIITGETSNTYNITKEGEYKVVITQLQECMLTQTLPFKAIYGVRIFKTSSLISNIVTPNGDGINDTWLIPAEYQNNETSIYIMDSRGNMVIDTKNYSNNWPSEETNIKSTDAIFYYIITSKSEGTQRGIINILK